MEWIRVEDELPDYGVEVLACFKGQFEWVMFFATNRHGQLVADGYAKPTHWAPRPDPPQEQA